MSKADVIRELARLGPDALTALVNWLDGEDNAPAPNAALDRLPDVLRTEIEFERLQARAKR